MTFRPPGKPVPSFSRQVAPGLTLLVGLAVAARAWLQFHTPLAPGMNGAYYFVQARALLERGRLGIPDFPLTFYLQAAFAWLLEHAGGLAQERAIVAAVKISDSLLPPLVAVPVAWLGWRWRCGNRAPSVLAALAPASVVCLGAQALSMTGDFQKNALALVWFAALALALHVFLDQRGWRNALAPLGFLALLGLTHVGVLGAALVFVGGLAVAATGAAGRKNLSHVLVPGLFGAGVLVLTGVIAYAAFDPARIKRLAQAFLQPSSFVGSHAPGGGPPPGGKAGGGPGIPLMNPPPDGPPPPPPGPAFGSPGAPGSGWVTGIPAGLCLLLGAGGMGLAWSRRGILSAADFAVAVAASGTAAALGGPFFDGEMSDRLLLIAAVPAAMALSFLLAQVASRLVRVGIGGLVLAAVGAGVIVYLPHGGRAAIAEETRAELGVIARALPAGGRALVVARHGLEWWAAWVLHTRIAQPGAVTTGDWSRFDPIYYLTEKHRDEFPGPAPGMPPGERHPSGGGPFGTRVPENARVVFAGRQLTLSLVSSAPEWLDEE